MTIYLLSWFGLVDLDYVSIPIGAYRTEEDAIESAENIGPGEHPDGSITVFKCSFPGKFIGAIPIRRWDYKTLYDSADNKCARLSGRQI